MYGRRGNVWEVWSGEEAEEEEEEEEEEGQVDGVEERPGRGLAVCCRPSPSVCESKQ